ncbi:MAG: hypothetical protein AABY37_01410 [Actinomycetota bacterium]
MTITPIISEIANLKPRLKVGTLVLPRGERTFVGRIDSGIEVSLPAAQIILIAMTGSASCQEISTDLGVPLDRLACLVRELDRANLLDTQQTKITVHTRFHSPSPHRSTHLGDDSNDGAYRQLQSKLSPELSFTTWLSDVRDGGVSLMSERRNCEITIFGDSRIATLLYGILLGSGISHTSLIISREPATITEQDLCAGYLRASDIGLSLKSRTNELARELSLFPVLPSQSVDKERLTQKINVAIGTPPADQLQQWMSEGVPHLLVENPDCAAISIGPLVLPGKTPCWRCICLAKEEQNIVWREIEWQKMAARPAEVPVAVAHNVAGLVALELLRFIDVGQSELIGNSVRLNYHSPCNSERRLYTRHPACGCNW